MLIIFDFISASKKNINDQVVIYLDFELDLNAMKVHLSQNKRFRILKVINNLQKIYTMIYISLEEILSFLLHCCIVIPLRRSFLRELYSLLHRLLSRKCLHLRFVAKWDLKWWTWFLIAWSSISLIQITRINHDMIINVNSLYEIDKIYNEQLFSIQVSIKYYFKYINIKKMLIMLHVFLL